MLFGFIGISFLFKLRFRKVSYLLILIYLFIPDLIYLGLSIVEWYSMTKFPPLISPSPIKWGHSLIINIIIGGLTAVIIIAKKKEKSFLISSFLPALHVLIDSFSIFYPVYYFYPFFEQFNSIYINAYYQYSQYLKGSYFKYSSYNISIIPIETIYWVVDLLTLLVCLVFCIWRIAKTEFEEKIVTKLGEDLIIPSDYSLIHQYPRIEGLSYDENKVFTQLEWENLAKEIRSTVTNFRKLNEEESAFQYKYPAFERDVPIIKKSISKNYEKQIISIYIEIERKNKLNTKDVSVKALKTPLIKKGKLFIILLKTINKINQRELLYVSSNGNLFFLNRGKDNIIDFNEILKNEGIKIINIEQVLNIIQLFMELFGCYRERILYSIQEIDRWRLYDYKNPDLEYETTGLPINSIEVYKLENSLGINLWTWGDFFSKWALIYYQFQLFPEGFVLNTFPFYRMIIYSGAFSSDK